MSDDCSAVILAAGDSLRMGQPKCLLKTVAGRSFLEEAAAAFVAFGCKQVVVVVHPSLFPDLQSLFESMDTTVSLTSHSRVKTGRFASLQTGLLALKTSMPVFFLNVDNPSVSHRILHEMLTHSKNSEVVRPVYDGRGGHPVWLAQNTVDSIVQQSNAALHLRDFLENRGITDVEVNDPSILWNINTPIDYQNFMKGKAP